MSGKTPIHAKLVPSQRERQNICPWYWWSSWSVLPPFWACKAAGGADGCDAHSEPACTQRKDGTHIAWWKGPIVGYRCNLGLFLNHLGAAWGMLWLLGHIGAARRPGLGALGPSWSGLRAMFAPGAKLASSMQFVGPPCGPFSCKKPMFVCKFRFGKRACLQDGHHANSCNMCRMLKCENAIKPIVF